MQLRVVFAAAHFFKGIDCAIGKESKYAIWYSLNHEECSRISPTFIELTIKVVYFIGAMMQFLLIHAVETTEDEPSNIGYLITNMRWRFMKLNLFVIDWMRRQ